MARLIYSAIGSADGYVEDAAGSFDWAAPDEELLSFVNDLERPVGTYLYGRRMYETMRYWEADHTAARLSTGSSPASGGRPTRSCSPAHSRRCPRPGRGSSGTSIPVWSGN